MRSSWDDTDFWQVRRRPARRRGSALRRLIGIGLVAGGLAAGGSALIGGHAWYAELPMMMGR